jgi:hypothetical protein
MPTTKPRADPALLGDGEMNVDQTHEPKPSSNRVWLKREHLWQTLRLLLACGLAWAATLVVGLKEVYWALITAMVVTRPGTPQTLQSGRDRILATLELRSAFFSLKPLSADCLRFPYFGALSFRLPWSPQGGHT